MATLFPASAQPDPREIASKIIQLCLDFARFCYLWLEDAWPDILRSTRSWLQYGTVGFAVICIVIGAVEGLFGR